MVVVLIDKFVYVWLGGIFENILLLRYELDVDFFGFLIDIIVLWRFKVVRRCFWFVIIVCMCFILRILVMFFGMMVKSSEL